MNAVFIALWAAAVMTGSAATTSIASEASTVEGLDFARTYSWAGAPASGDALRDQRLVAGIDARLEAKGWKRRASGGRLTLRVDIVPDTPVPHADTVLVKLFDAASHKAVWHGTANGGAATSMLARDRALDAGLDQMFAAFPMRQTAAR